MKSEIPLRYPGGKRRFVEYVEQFALANNCFGKKLVEPYAGSAAISLGLLNSGTIDSAYLVERDPLVACFWKAALYDSERLSDLVLSTEISLKRWEAARAYLKIKDMPQDKNAILDCGLNYLILNRTCYSGIITAGPIGGKSQSSSYPIDCRFNRVNVGRMIRLMGAHKNHISISCEDGAEVIKSIAKLEDVFLYVDPPYFEQGSKLYRFSFDEKKHTELAEVLTGIENPWLLSYDDVPFIKGLYGSQSCKKVYFDYTVRVSRTASELAISNRVLPPVYVVDGAVKYRLDDSSSTQESRSA